VIQHGGRSTDNVAVDAYLAKPLHACYVYICLERPPLSLAAMPYHIVLDELVPSRPCEDFAYRFRTVGRLEGHSTTEKDAIKRCHALLASSTTHPFCVRVDGVVLWDLGAKGWSAWHSATRRCVRVTSENVSRVAEIGSRGFLLLLTAQ
jgi:hypothetical protein